jgi:hypothetical protein
MYRQAGSCAKAKAGCGTARAFHGVAMTVKANLSFTEWIAAVRADLRAAGFRVDDHLGYPFVPALEKFIAEVEAAKVRISVPVTIKLYQEGALFLPAGGDRWLDELEEDHARPSVG